MINNLFVIFSCTFFLQQKKVPKKNCPKIQLNGFVALHIPARMGPKAIQFAHFWGLPTHTEEQASLLNPKVFGEIKFLPFGLINQISIENNDFKINDNAFRKAK